MKIKIDENLPLRLAVALTNIGHDVETVHGEKLSGAKDEELWAAAQNEHRLLITQDLDFSDNRQFQPGSHYGIILVRLRSPGRELLFRKVTDLFLTEEVESWKGCFVVVTDHKLRIRRPAQ